MRLTPWRQTPRGGISPELLRLPVLMLLFQHISKHPARLGIRFGPRSRALAAKGIMPPSSWLLYLLHPTFPGAASLTQTLVVSFRWKPSRCSCLNCHLWSARVCRGIVKIKIERKKKADVSDTQEPNMCVFFSSSNQISSREITSGTPISTRAGTPASRLRVSQVSPPGGTVAFGGAFI